MNREMPIASVIPMLSIAMLLGCSQHRTTPQPESSHMFEHFEQVGRIQTSVIDGDIDGLRGPAEWMVQHESMAGLPEGSEEFQVRMRSFARLASEAQTVDQAAQAVSQMAGTCGSCHTTYSRGPTFRAESSPPEETVATRGTRMVRHLWAADRMWEGLIGPSDSAWRSGARVLHDAPLVPGEATDDVSRWARVIELAESVRALGDRAMRADGRRGRVRIYGELISTCASCHSLVEGIR